MKFLTDFYYWSFLPKLLTKISYWSFILKFLIEVVWMRPSLVETRYLSWKLKRKTLFHNQRLFWLFEAFLWRFALLWPFKSRCDNFILCPWFLIKKNIYHFFFFDDHQAHPSESCLFSSDFRFCFGFYFSIFFASEILTRVWGLRKNATKRAETQFSLSAFALAKIEKKLIEKLGGEKSRKNSTGSCLWLRFAPYMGWTLNFYWFFSFSKTKWLTFFSFSS